MMKFLTFTILVLAALTRGEGVQDKRGIASGQQTFASAAPASIAYTKLQQPVQKQLLAAAPQPQYYTQTAAAPQAYSFPAAQQQLQYQPQAQAVAYAQPSLAKYAAAPAASQVYAAAPAAVGKVAAPVYRQPFSLANDVSSFTYSSPVVAYNSLGYLSQVVGKIANPPVQVQAKAVEAPAPAVYQAQPAAYAQVAQTRFAIPQRAQAPSPQQYLTQVPQQQAQQAYSAAPQAQAYQAAQNYQATQNAPQAFYSQAPQYFGSAVQQVKQQVNPGVQYAQ